MKNILIIASFCVLGMGVTSCCSTKEVPTENVQLSTKFVTEYVHDTIFVVNADTSSFTADLVVSDSGRIYIQNSASINGKYVHAPKVVIKNNRIKVDCTAEAQRLFKQWKSKYILEKKSNTFTRTKLVEKELSLWEKFEVWTGRIALIVAFIGLFSYFIKTRKIKL